MGSRRHGREAALQMLYQMDVSGVGAEAAIRLYWEHLGASEDGQELADQIVRGYEEKGEAIDERIRAVSQHWRLERMNLVDRNILRSAIYELSEVDGIPLRVTLNEAVELAKKYGASGTAGFVNGILDRVAREIKKEKKGSQPKKAAAISEGSEGSEGSEES